MSYSRYSSSSQRNNPQAQITRTLKMQNLLEQYDQENKFLGKQVKQLLQINKILSRNQSSESITKNLYSLCNQNKITDHRNKIKRYEYFSSVDDPLISKMKRQKKHFYTETKQQNSQNTCLKQIKETAYQNKKVKFTRQPYIQKSDIQVKNPEIIDEQRNSPLRKPANHSNFLLENNQTPNVQKDSSPVRRSSLKKRKSGIEVTDRSKSKQRSQASSLNKSKISNKSQKSKKSGIQVYSSPRKSEDKIDLPMSSQDHSTKKLEFYSDKKSINKAHQTLQTNPSSSKLRAFPAEKLFTVIPTKPQYATFGIQTQNSRYSMQEDEPRRINKKQSEQRLIQTNNFTRFSSMPNFDQRSQSQSRHRIAPSHQISNFDTQSQVRRKNSTVIRQNSSQKKQGKKRFINLLTKKLLDQGKNLTLTKHEFRK